MKNPALIAEAIIDELGINSVADLQLLDCIAYARKAIIRHQTLRSAEARLVIGFPYSVITVNSSGDPRRERFSIAHELGHLELHHDIRLFPCNAESVNRWPAKQSNNEIEPEANEFAANLLLPRKLFEPLCTEDNPSMNFVTELATQFNVSITATARRYVEYSYEPVAVVWTERRYIKWFKGSESFGDLGFFVNVGSVIDDKTVAAKFFNGESMLTVPKPVNASSWVSSRKYQNASLMEHCIPMPTYNGVLSLIWLDEDTLDEDEEDW